MWFAFVLGSQHPYLVFQVLIPLPFSNLHDLIPTIFDAIGINNNPWSGKISLLYGVPPCYWKDVQFPLVVSQWFNSFRSVPKKLLCKQKQGCECLHGPLISEVLIDFKLIYKRHFVKVTSTELIPYLLTNAGSSCELPFQLSTLQTTYSTGRKPR